MKNKNIIFCFCSGARHGGFNPPSHSCKAEANYKEIAGQARNDEQKSSLTYTRTIIIFFGLLIFLGISKTFSQGIMYGYDDNGNRTLRDVIVLTQNKSTVPPDSTNNAIDSTLADPTLVQTNSADSLEASKQNRIEASFAGNKVLIYPNPAKYYITVEIENISGKKTEINVCDVFGKSIEKIQVTDNRTLIDFSQKAIGTYLLKMTIDNKSDIWKIVKE